ncbi:MAG TPA: HDOD domain-containing protein [Pseudoxanthomonas sp.]|nr:HDOD domain-containing protein [Pseudoxanthomonas sp.]
MRVLFVDDEEKVLAGMERTLFMADLGWDAEFARSGAEALERLAARPADVVVSDMRMPIMDGGELLRRVRDGWPCAVRIILSGHTEQEAALRSLDVAHQFLSKPCDGEAMIEAIQRAVNLQTLLRDKAIQEVVGRIGSLPAAPRMYERFNRLLSDGTSNIGQISAVVQSEPALAAKVLQLANCAFFRIGHDVADIHEAVVHIGLNTLRTLVLASEVFRSCCCGQADAMRMRAVRASRLAAAIAEPYALIETVTSAALLADVGRLLPGVDRLCEEVDVDGTGFPSHAEVGAYLLGMWGLPGAIIEAVAHHHAPGRVNHSEFDAVGVVHVAVTLSQGLQPDLEYLQKMRVADRLPAWQQACRTVLEGES